MLGLRSAERQSPVVREIPCDWRRSRAGRWEHLLAEMRRLSVLHTSPSWLCDILVLGSESHHPELGVQKLKALFLQEQRQGREVWEVASFRHLQSHEGGIFWFYRCS